MLNTQCKIKLIFLTITLFTGSVFCCDIDKTGKYVVTGGEDDMAYVWDIANGSIEIKCSGHKVCT
jgi:WD40 repeat protein